MNWVSREYGFPGLLIRPWIGTQRDLGLQCLGTRSGLVQIDVAGPAEFLMASLASVVFVAQVVGALAGRCGTAFDVHSDNAF